MFSRHENKRPQLFPILLVSALALLIAASAHAALEQLPSNECEIPIQGGTPGPNDCYSDPDYVYFGAAGTVPTPYVGARSNPGSASGAIDVWGICRYIDNVIGNSAFVPLKSQAEWHSFYSAQTNVFSLTTCARARQETITPDGNCTSPTPASQQINLPYARTGSTEQTAVDFICGAGSPWAGEEVQVTYLALNSDVDNPDWKVANISYKQTQAGSCAAQVVDGDDIMCPSGGPMLPNSFNLPPSPAGTTCKTTCICDYHSYSVPYTCTAGLWQRGQEQMRYCFLGDVTVTLADGTQKPMTALKAGDVVQGRSRDNKVVSVATHVVSQPIYGFNGGKAFVTGGHPFWTKDGWKAINPALTPVEEHGVITTQLRVGDELMLNSGQKLKITSIDEHDMGPQQVFSPVLDGDHTYFANGILVHNKPNHHQGDRCPDTGLLTTCFQ